MNSEEYMMQSSFNVMEELDSPAIRDILVTADISSIKETHTLYKRITLYDTLTSAKEALALAFLDFDLYKNNVDYIAYLEGYRQAIIEILCIMEGTENKHKEQHDFHITETLPGSDISNDIGDIQEEQDDDIFDSEAKFDELEDPGILMEYREKALNNKYIDCDLYQEILWSLKDTGNVFHSDDEGETLEPYEEWQEKYRICIQNAINLYPQWANFYVLAGHFMLNEKDNIKKAYEYYYKAESLSPGEEDSNDLYVSLLTREEKYEELDTFINDSIPLSIHDYDITDYDMPFGWYQKLFENAVERSRPLVVEEYFGALLNLIEAYADQIEIEKEIEENGLSSIYYTGNEENPNFILNATRNLIAMSSYLVEDMQRMMIDKTYERIEKNGKVYHSLLLAGLHYEIGEYDAAIALYESLEEYEEAAECYRALGDFYGEFTSYELAIKDDINPEEADPMTYEAAWNAITSVPSQEIQNSERLECMIFVCEKAISLWPNDKEWVNRLVEVYYTNDVIHNYSYKKLSHNGWLRAGIAAKYITAGNLHTALTATMYMMGKDEEMLQIAQDLLGEIITIAEKQEEKSVLIRALHTCTQITGNNKKLVKSIKQKAKRVFNNSFENKVIRTTSLHKNTKKL